MTQTLSPTQPDTALQTARDLQLNWAKTPINSRFSCYNGPQIERAVEVLGTLSTALTKQPVMEAVMAEDYPTKLSTKQSKRDLKGQRFGRLVALEYAGYRQKSRSYMWRCACDCGGQKTTREEFLLKGGCLSCGCIRREQISRLGHSMATHGESRVGRHSPEYQCWSRIKARCHRPSHHHYKHYGARGIQVCEKWRNSFEAFLVDVGRRPGPGYSIDRIDVNGNYEPGNVRWATQTQQCRNRRNTRLIALNGEAHTAAEWAEITGIPSASITYRVRVGWLPEYALTVPVGNQNKGLDSQLYRGRV